ncbi:MAG: hypothetical protein ACLQVI_11725 [Polyangiaceae bacterium]
MTSARALTLAACAAVVATFEVIFRPYFPTLSGEVANDYAYVLAHLYDGALWFRANGALTIPWFSPSFCGGIPAYANPHDGYFALPQVLDLVVGPLAAIHATALAFSALGFLGFYVLMRQVFGAGRGAAAYAGGLFALNGFYLWRMVQGELSVHAFMLTPLVAWGALVPAPEKRGALVTRDACVAGGAIGYAIHAGAIDLLPIVALSVVAIALVYGVTYGATWRMASDVFARLTTSVFVGLALAAGKVATMIALFAHTTRETHAIPGVREARDLAELVLVPLFSRPRADHLEAVIVSAQWTWRASELELGVGPVPVVLLAVGALVGPVLFALRARRGLPAGSAGRIARSVAWSAALLLLLALPLALNVYSAELGPIARLFARMQDAPSLFRLLSVFVPVTILASAIVVDRLIDWRAHALVAVAAVTLLAYGDLKQSVFDYEGGYSPAPIVAAHHQLSENHFVPPIDRLAPVDLNANPLLPLGQTAAGLSTYPCYEPLFGDLMETFPKNDLHPGPVTDVTGHEYNLLDPSCFLFPDENQCAPGDRLVVEGKERFDSFRLHRGITFVRPWWQRLADAMTFVALATVLIVLVGWALDSRA